LNPLELRDDDGDSYLDACFDRQADGFKRLLKGDEADDFKKG